MGCIKNSDREDFDLGVTGDGDTASDFDNLQMSIFGEESLDPKPVLGYWNFRGLGQPIRYLLAYMGVDYIERAYPSYEIWSEDKDKLGLDFPNLPYWIDEDAKLTEVRAIIKYLARKYEPGLAPSTPALQRQADMMEGVLRDVFYATINLISKYTDEAVDDFEREQPLKLQNISAYLGTKKWILHDDNISYLDFVLYEVLIHQKRFHAELLFDPFPNFSVFLKNFESLPAIKKFMTSSTPNFMSAPLLS